MYRFSLIVPLLGSSKLFDDTLASVLRYRCDACQIIVAHDGSYDDPYGLGREVDFVCVQDQPAQLIQLFNAGLELARGEWIGLLRPGAQLDEGWDESVRASFADADVGCVAPAIVATDKPSRLITAGVTVGPSFGRKMLSAGRRFNTRRATSIKPLGPSSWAAFYRRSLLTSLGSCDEQLDPHYLDVDLALSLQNLNFGCAFCPDCVIAIDDPAIIRDEIRLPHGKSAQRSLVRQRALTSSQRWIRTTLTTFGEIVSSPWRPAKLKQAFQRLGALRTKNVDQLHWDLLSVLNKQRQRLVEPTSATPKIIPQNSSTGFRKAA